MNPDSKPNGYGWRYALGATRTDKMQSRDDFPTPPWATRALLEHVLGGKAALADKTCLEPACGAGHMAKPLKQYFGEVTASDAYAYGYGEVRDFCTYPYEVESFDWVITNPPFNLAEGFILRALHIAREGVAVLVRSVFIESVGRYERLFRDQPLSDFAQFVERVPMVRGRIDIDVSTATGYAWLVWRKCYAGPPRLVWIPPCRKRLERFSDYR